MNINVAELLSLAGPPLGHLLTEPLAILAPLGKRGKELTTLLMSTNGFVAFESALHIFPIGHASDGYDLEQWNSPDLWRSAYGDMAENAFFFAEDIFGEQFCIRDDHIHRFNPETGQIKQIAANLGEWAERILVNYNMETGFSHAHAWQQANGPLPLDQRLLPQIPFILGGLFEANNLYAIEAVQGMLFRADIARQIRDIPDGSKIRLVIRE